jgi:hypothetical protein
MRKNLITLLMVLRELEPSGDVSPNDDEFVVGMNDVISLCSVMCLPHMCCKPVAMRVMFPSLLAPEHYSKVLWHFSLSEAMLASGMGRDCPIFNQE